MNTTEQKPHNVIFFFDTCAQKKFTLSGLLDKICKVNKASENIHATLGMTDMLLDEAGFVSPLLLTETMRGKETTKLQQTLNQYRNNITVFGATPCGKNRLSYLSKKFLETQKLPESMTLADMLELQEKSRSYKGKDIIFQEDRGEISILQTLLLNETVPDNSLIIFLTEDKQAANAFKRLSRNVLSDQFPLDAEVLAAMPERTEKARRARIDEFNQKHRIQVWDKTLVTEDDVIQSITRKHRRSETGLKLSPAPEAKESMLEYFAHCHKDTLAGYLEACLNPIVLQNTANSCTKILENQYSNRSIPQHYAGGYGGR
jgi:hypothetical protein